MLTAARFKARARLSCTPINCEFGFHGWENTCSRSLISDERSMNCLASIISVTSLWPRGPSFQEGYRLTDDASAERQHAHDENHTLHDRHPGPKRREVILQGNDDESAHDRTEDRS